MAASSSSSTRDLSIVPDISFSFVENFIRSRHGSSGKEQMSKGFKHSVAVFSDEAGCLIRAKCYRSQRKNESPHEMKVLINSDKIEHSFCSCTIGQSGNCGHVSALLYQIAHYKKMNLTLIPTDIAKTSLPQTWHVPRGEKLRGEKTDNLTIRGYDKENPLRRTKGIKSTLYNPVSKNESVDINTLLDKMADTNILFNTVVGESSDTVTVDTRFGKFQKGSPISYQQKLSGGYIVNLVDNNTFPILPAKNVMLNNVNFVLTEQQMKSLESLKVSEVESKEIEELTRFQSQDPKWHRIRRDRITASKAGEIAKRRADGEKLADRLKSTRHVQTAAMKRGIECEDVAAQAYSEKMDNEVNIFPCGVIVSPYCHWIAATPDRKLYMPNRNPSYGLLEIKCPNTDDLTKVKCLTNTNGQLRLKTNDNYYYQIQTQMAVTGLSWCDFFVWLENDVHLETIYFDEDFWQQAKDKLDAFFFDYYLN
ncbi:uncharacterized protein LOC134239948 [Saccostrea cucullata]|uniref:uncharacterized protein LOC134239948 n=1 Tax=Saccostrea cuccullata TaxID=36930 RepID=UPI002ED6C0F2